MKLTCVTAVFNSVKSGNRDRLIRCIESVAALKTDHEHLIYDGSSTDGTVELLRELERTMPGLKVVSEPDAGIYNALNKGVSDASGEWFYVLGSDDYISHPEVMDELLAEEDARTEIIVAPVERDGGPKLFTKLADLARMMSTFVCSHQGIIMKTELVREFGGFDERYRICADSYMHLLCHMQARNFHYIFTSFAFYASGGASETGDTGRLENIDIHMDLFKLSGRERARYQIARTPPLRVVVPMLMHKDYALRIGARYVLWSRIKDVLRVALYPLVLLKRRLYRK